MSMKYFRGESTLSIQCNACILLAIRLRPQQQQLSTHARLFWGLFFRRENPHTQTQKLHNRLDYFIVLGSSTTIHTSPPIFLPFFQFIFFFRGWQKSLKKFREKLCIGCVVKVIFFWGGDEKGTTFNEVFLTLIYRTFQKPKPSLFLLSPLK